MGNNPVLKGKHICDPHACTVGDKVYLSVGVDRGMDSETWAIDRWEIYSSGDLRRWKRECVIKPENFYMGKSEHCWATDLTYKNGYFYFYFSDHNREIGVLRSKDCKMFEDVLGGPLIPEGFCDTLSYDPTVFTDDDGKSYLLFGCEYEGHYHIVQLGEDMVSLAGGPVRLKIKGLTKGDDKSYLHKHGGLYYLTSGSFFAVSDSLFGEYEFRGCFRASRDHGSFFDFHGQNYFAFTIFDPTVFCRTTGITYVNYLDNGDIVTDGLPNECGVGYYDACWNGIECEWYFSGVGVRKTDNFWNRIDVEVDSDSELYFPDVRNLFCFNAISFYGVSSDGLKIFVRERDRNGKILASVALKASGGESIGCYYTRAVGAFTATTTTDLCFTFEGKGKIDFFKFFNVKNQRKKKA